MTPDEKKRIEEIRIYSEGVGYDYTYSAEVVPFLLAKLDEAHKALRLCLNTVGYVPDGQSTIKCITAINDALGEEWK